MTGKVSWQLSSVERFLARNLMDRKPTRAPTSPNLSSTSSLPDLEFEDNCHQELEPHGPAGVVKRSSCLLWVPKPQTSSIFTTKNGWRTHPIRLLPVRAVTGPPGPRVTGQGFPSRPGANIVKFSSQELRSIFRAAVEFLREAFCPQRH